MKGGISSRELGDAGQPSGGGAAERIKGGDLERLLTHPSHPGPRSFAWTGRGLGEAGPAVSSRFHPQPHRHPPPDLRESDLSAPQNWDSSLGGSDSAMASLQPLLYLCVAAAHLAGAQGEAPPGPNPAP